MTDWPANMPKPTWRSKDGSVLLYHGDNLSLLLKIAAASISGLLFVTDPPYGCQKAEWDHYFPTEWYSIARRSGGFVGIITGSAGLKDAIGLVGEDYIDTIAARNMNGMTRGPIGFGNWLACVVAIAKPPQGINAFDFVVSGDMPDHPSPKPIEYMERLVRRVSVKESVVLDPFMGSGTTGVACVRLSRRFVGIEIDRKYFDIAVRRIEEAFDSQALFRQDEQREPDPELFEAANDSAKNVAVPESSLDSNERAKA